MQISLFVTFQVNSRRSRTLAPAGQGSQHWPHKQQQQQNQIIKLPTLASSTAAATPSTTSPPPASEYLAICVFVKGQKRYLPEWFIHHYYHLNVGRFYVMDDGTEPPLSDTSGWGVPRAAITFDYLAPGQTRAKYNTDPSRQLQHAYNMCARKYGSRHKWLAFIDANEFLELQATRNPRSKNKSTTTLQSFLRGFENNTSIGALGVNWQVHTSAGLSNVPFTSYRKTFTTCIKDDPKQDNRRIKMIVKTAHYDFARSAHAVALKNGTRTVGERGDAIPGAFRTPITRDSIALHHYVVNSKAELGSVSDVRSPRNLSFWDHIEGLPSVRCDSMVKYEP
ncbi:hypothetical protein HDU86_006674 [Geranomyces michiganensis]|nr:hypothetical protein HDU86_006674 [Geranomyces michiganensis]